MVIGIQQQDRLLWDYNYLFNHFINLLKFLI